jgi:hypothetical protein
MTFFEIHFFPKHIPLVLIFNYLDFRFVFTQLDPNDPAREFSFFLSVNEEEKYDIMDCVPSIEVTELMEILDNLNRDEDMSALVRRMRTYTVKEFVNKLFLPAN